MLSKITIILTTFVSNTDDVHVNDLAYFFFFSFFWKGSVYGRKKSVGHDLPMVESLRICSFSSRKTNWDALFQDPLFVLVYLVTLNFITWSEPFRSYIIKKWKLNQIKQRKKRATFLEFDDKSVDQFLG